MNETQGPSEAIDSIDQFARIARLADERAADIVEFLNEETPEVAAHILVGLPRDRAIEVIDQPSLDRGPEIISLLPREIAADLLAGASADRVADLFRQLEEPARVDLLGRLDTETRANIQRLLSYPAGTAGSIMTTEFVSVPSSYTVDQTLDHIRHVESTRETVSRFTFSTPVLKNLSSRSHCAV